MDALESAAVIAACRNVILQHKREHESNIMLMMRGIKVSFHHEMELHMRAIMAKKTIDAFEGAESVRVPKDAIIIEGDTMEADPIFYPIDKLDSMRDGLLAKAIWEGPNLPMGTLVIE